MYICMRIQFFWNVMMCHWSYSAQHFEEMCHHLVKIQALQEVQFLKCGNHLHSATSRPIATEVQVGALHPL
jgi:hypothetical protein